MPFKSMPTCAKPSVSRLLEPPRPSNARSPISSPCSRSCAISKRRKPMPTNDDPHSLMPDEKFKRIAAEIKANIDWRALLAGTRADELAASEEIANHYEGGQTLDTGGNCIVVLIPLGEHDCMGVSSE